MSSNTISIDNLRDRVRNHNLKKQASATPSSATDPAEKGGAAATKDPMLSDEKSKLPASKENVSNEGQKLEDKELQPSSTGKNLPISPKDGDAEDKKGVEKAAGIRSRIQKLMGKEATAKTEGKPAAGVVSKSAAESELPVNLGPDALYKLASAIFETDDGIDAILPVLRKKAGRDAAVEMMKAAAAEYQAANEAAFYAQELQKQANAEVEAYEYHIAELIKGASSKDEATRLVKAAAVHFENTRGLNDFEKMAYAQGPEDAAAMMGPDPAAGGDPAAEAGGLEGAEAPTIEQIAQLIQLAVQNQEISPEDGEAMLAELAGAGTAGGPEGGLPPEAGAEAPPAEAPVEEAPPAEGEDSTKEASAKSRALLNKLRKGK